MSRVHTKLSEITPIRPACIDAHPKRPWIASAADNGVVRIFDYMYNQLVHQFSLADLEVAEKNAQLLQVMAEKDPTYKGPRKPEPKTNKKAIGAINIIKFVDQDIRFNKFRQEVRIRFQLSASLPSAVSPFECPTMPSPCPNLIF